jgi:transcriptional regulator with XRE-family HTH domain
MGPTSSPTVWRRWLAFELRRLREERGLAQREAGKACGWSGARLSYIENAQQNIVEDDLEKLLPLYEVPESRWPEFHEAARRSREKGWWERYDDRVVPDYLSLYVGLEQGASLIRSVEPLGIPGLLQTADYVAAQLRLDVTPRTEQQIARIVELRMARQDILTRADAPVELSAVIDESTLHRVAGGPGLMADQLTHLLKMAERPNITVRVFPFAAGVVTSLASGYRILSFPGWAEPGVVYIEHREGAIYLDDANDVDGHVLAFEHLVSLALTPEDSMAMVREAAARYAR